MKVSGIAIKLKFRKLELKVKGVLDVKHYINSEFLLSRSTDVYLAFLLLNTASLETHSSERFYYSHSGVTCVWG